MFDGLRFKLSCVAKKFAYLKITEILSIMKEWRVLRNAYATVFESSEYLAKLETFRFY